MSTSRLEAIFAELGFSGGSMAMLSTAVQVARADVHADRTALYVPVPGRDDLARLLCLADDQSDGVALEPVSVEPRASVRAALLHRRPVVISDTRIDPSWKAAVAHDDVRALLALPLVSETGEVCGVLEHHFRAPYQPSRDDLQRCEANGRLLAAMIEKIHQLEVGLVREVAAARRQAEFLETASVRLVSSLDYEETLESVVRVGLSLGADACTIRVGDQPIQILAAHCDREKEAELRRRLAADDTPFEELLRKQGLRWLMTVPLLVGGRALGTLTFGLAERDFEPADRALAEALAHRAALAIDHAQLYRAAQLAITARQELLAIVSHDLSNLVATIRMSAELLARFDGGKERRKGRKQIEFIRRGAERMEHFLRDLLDGAAVESGHFAINRAPQSVNQLLADAVEAMLPAAEERKLSLVHEPLSDDLEIACDPLRILQVLINLIGNALKFTPKGRISVRAVADDHGIRFEVEDQGVGIQPEDLDRIFDRFWTSSRKGQEGTGLGLYISKAIVEAHGGEMSVTSVPEVQTIFSFWLPR